MLEMHQHATPPKTQTVDCPSACMAVPVVLEERTLVSALICSSQATLLTTPLQERINLLSDVIDVIHS